MDKKINEEREFSENIDRLLAGEEVKAGEDISEDYRTAINFAQKLIRLRDEPSPHFKDRLKRQLLLKLAEQEAEAARKKERANWFWEALRNLIPQNPVWRTAVAMFLVVVVTGGVFWGTGIFTQAPMAPGIGAGEPEKGAPRPVMETSVQTLLELEAIPSETTVYPFGEEVKIDLVFKNVSSESITIAPFPPAIQLSRAESGEVKRSLAEGNERREISPSGTLTFTLAWDQMDDNWQQVGPGRYSIIVNDVTIHKDTEPGETHLGFGLLTDLLIQPLQ